MATGSVQAGYLASQFLRSGTNIVAVAGVMAGEWGDLEGLASSPVHNPSTGDLIAETRMGLRDQVNEAVEAGAAAFPAWRETPPTERVRVMFRFRSLLEDNFEEIV